MHDRYVRAVYCAKVTLTGAQPPVIIGAIRLVFCHVV